MARAILKQRWKKVHNYGVDCGPIFLDMACIFGLPNGKNDINVLDQSPLVTNMLNGACSLK
jgi:hypothetical protein